MWPPKSPAADFFTVDKSVTHEGLSTAKLKKLCFADFPFLKSTSSYNAFEMQMFLFIFLNFRHIKQKSEMYNRNLNESSTLYDVK